MVLYLGFFVVLWNLCLLGGCHGSASSSPPPYHDPSCGGGRQVIVQLFEWKWADIARECLDYLGPMGFCGVQVSPPNEHIVVKSGTPKRPWWERYQPVSYELTSRSGNQQEFTAMVHTCKSAGVSIYVEAVISHMASNSFSGLGSGGTRFDAQSFHYPGVPYTAANRKNDTTYCPPATASTTGCSPTTSFATLDLSQDYVRGKIAAYFNQLLAIGVAGFRIEDADQIAPADIKAIQDKTNDLPEEEEGGSGGRRPFFIQDVRDRSTLDQYYDTGYVTEYRYGSRIEQSKLKDFDKVYDSGSTMAPSRQAVVFVDDHNTQRSNGDNVLTFKKPLAYKRAVAFTLAYDYGLTTVMSSYAFKDAEQGPPINDNDDDDDDDDGPSSIKNVTITSPEGCGNGWICEHRWRPIGRMAFFRNVVAGEHVQNWSYDHDKGVVSFSRGRKGFFAMARDDFSVTVYTGLPSGEYCDLISACARTVIVDSRGFADISPASGSEPFVAIVARNGKPWYNRVAKDAVPFSPATLGDYRRTVILVERHIGYGEEMFIRGGIDINRRAGCIKGDTPSPCSIPIRHIDPGSNARFDKVKAWSKGDNYLDWNGPEVGQGTYNGDKAQGTPTYWSTSDTNNPGYSRYNKYGSDYWQVEVDMDCSKTMGGYFEFKGYINGGWEIDLNVGDPCDGDFAGKPPYSSKNHFARCGYLNVFHYSQKSCEISGLEE